MWQYVNAEELYHYGVKGMKWGVRRHGRSTINGQLKRPRAMDEGGVYSTGKGHTPKYTLPKGRTTKLGKKLKNMNDVLMQTTKNNRKSVSRGKLFVDAINSRKHTLSKVDEFILQTQGKKTNNYEKVSTVGGTQYRKKGRYGSI